MSDETCARCGAHQDDHYTQWENGIPIVGSYHDAPNGRVCSNLAEELKAAVLQNEKLEKELESLPDYYKGLVPRLDAEIKRLTDNNKEIRSKWRESERLTEEMKKDVITLAEAILGETRQPFTPRVQAAFDTIAVKYVEKRKDSPEYCLCEPATTATIKKHREGCPLHG